MWQIFFQFQFFLGLCYRYVILMLFVSYQYITGIASEKEEDSWRDQTRNLPSQYPELPFTRDSLIRSSYDIKSSLLFFILLIRHWAWGRYTEYVQCIGMTSMVHKVFQPRHVSCSLFNLWSSVNTLLTTFKF